MCGIAGLLGKTSQARPRPDTIRRFTTAMVHRGPDGHGYYEDGPIALGHRRLAIIDLSEHGHQPMKSEDGQVVLVMNGEIYNHVDLRKELANKGHAFVSQTDSEVAIHLYEEVGERLPEYLRGMFAFAIWDRRRQKLLLARDRYGEKPLYYAIRPDGIAFASELAALLADEGTQATLDLLALDAYLALQYVPSPLSIFKEVRKLPPGHFVSIGPGEEPVPKPYFHTDFTPEPVEERTVIHAIRHTVTESVRVRLMSDVPLGAFLSGGVDSSIVVACMAQSSAKPVKTFSIGFPDAGDSELPYARLVAARWHTDHEEQIVSPDMVSVLPALARHHGEPFGDPSAVPTYYLAEMTRKRVTVALSGDAGDECFGGYKRYIWAHIAHLLGRLPRPVLQLAGAGLMSLPGGGSRFLREYGAHLGSDEAKRYLSFICHFSAEEKQCIYTPDLAATFAFDRTAERFAELIGRSRAKDPICRLMDLDVHTYLPDDILVKVDIASMAHSLESRAPLVDHHVMQLAARLPGNQKIRGLKGKHILKRAFHDVVPAPILSRRKKGFSLPLARWFRDKLGEAAEEMLLSRTACERGLFRSISVSDLFDRHRRGEDHSDRLWNLWVLETWFREMIDGRSRFVHEIARNAGVGGSPS